MFSNGHGHAKKVCLELSVYSESNLFVYPAGALTIFFIEKRQLMGKASNVRNCNGCFVSMRFRRNCPRSRQVPAKQGSVCGLTF